jgi:hypothetical protein
MKGKSNERTPKAGDEASAGRLVQPSPSGAGRRRRAKPLVVDLCAGLGGWTHGFLAEGYDAVGFDIERHQYGDKRYPAQLVLQDIRTLHGSQFRDAAVIVASPPCQAYSYRAMPWKRAKALGPPDNTLFEACFRIAREAGVPIVVENVKGAQPWVGRAAWHYGSYYLWGDVPALMPHARLRSVSKNAGTQGGTWFNIAHGKVIPGNQAGAPQRGDGLSDAVKIHGSGPEWWRKPLEAKRREASAIKNGGDWFSSGAGMSLQRAQNSKSTARKAASAMIAEIPFDLAQWIARCYLPEQQSVSDTPALKLASLNETQFHRRPQ